MAERGRVWTRRARALASMALEERVRNDFIFEPELFSCVYTMLMHVPALPKGRAWGGSPPRGGLVLM